MSSRADDEGSPMHQCRAADLADCVGLTKIDRHIAILHRRLDWIAQIALRDDVDFRIVLCKIDNGLSHSAFRSNEQNAHVVTHSTKPSPYPLPAGEVDIGRGCPGNQP